MTISDPTFTTKLALSNLHYRLESLSYRTGALFVVAFLVASVALLLFLACGIHSLITHKKLYLKVALPAIAAAVAMVPFIILGGMREVKHRKCKKDLQNAMKSCLLPHKNVSQKALIAFIEKNLIEDWERIQITQNLWHTNSRYKDWHRIYKTYLVTQMKEALKGEDENENLMKALGAVEQNLTKELEDLGMENS